MDLFAPSRYAAKTHVSISAFGRALIPQMRKTYYSTSSFLFRIFLRNFMLCLSVNHPISSSMTFELSVVNRDEMRDVVEMLFYAYDGLSAFVNAVYPHKITQHAIKRLEMVVARLQYLLEIDPSIRWYKVRDTSTGEVVSASQWNVYDEEKPQEIMLDGPPGSWATDEDKKCAIEMFESFITPRYTRYRQVDLPIICKFSNKS